MRKIECFKIRILEDTGEHIWEIENQRPIHDILCDIGQQLLFLFDVMLTEMVVDYK